MSSTPAMSKRPLILCIDDDEIVLRVRKLLLTGAGYEVEAASSEESGLEAFKQNPVELVMADHFLFDRTATEIAKTMKALKPQVPILIVSGMAEEFCDLEFADGFCSKGEPPDVLLDTVARLLKR
jgi:CheY-like chemotaxis protein